MGFNLQLLFTGIGVGSICALVALGFVLAFAPLCGSDWDPLRTSSVAARPWQIADPNDTLVFSCVSWYIGTA
jgi:hypothetical protein